MKKIFYLFATALFAYSSYAQVGVGTITPAGALDVSSTTQGLIPPRVALASSIVEAPVVNPAGGSIVAGTVVYNTATAGTVPNNVAPGLYFWNGTRWVAFAGSPGGLDWSLTGNSGTTVGTNFVGTTDANALGINTNNTERARILSNGHFLVNTTANNATSGADNIFEVLATTDGDDAVNGYATGTGIGVYGNNNGTGTGVLGTTNGSGIGVYGTTSGDGLGVYGSVNNVNAVAVYAINANVGGTSLVSAGGNTTANFYAASGVSGNGTDTGVAGLAKTVATGVGVRGNGNGVSTNTTSGVGAGVAGSGTQIGVFGHASNTTGTKNGGVFTSEHGAVGTAGNPYAYLAGSNGTLVYGGYFDGNQDTNNNDNGTNQGQDYAYVGVVSGNTTYKILGTGSVSTIVKDENNERRVLFAP